MSSLTYTGTDLIGEDDMTTDPPWKVNGTSVALVASDCGPHGGAAHKVTVGSAGAFKSFRADNVSLTAVDHDIHVWVTPGDDDSSLSVVMGALLNGWNVSSAQIIEGPGEYSITSGLLTVTNLVLGVWTLVKYTNDSAAGSGNADVYFYPGDDVNNQALNDSIMLGPVRCATSSSSPGWAYDGLTPGLGVLPGRGRPWAMGGQAYASNASPHSSLDIDRGRSWVIPAALDSATAGTLAEQRDDSDNYWRLHAAADGTLTLNCVVDGVNAGAATNAGALTVGTPAEIVVSIPRSGSARIIVDGVDQTRATAATLVGVGNGLSLGARVDGTEPHNGRLHGVHAMNGDIGPTGAQRLNNLSQGLGYSGTRIRRGPPKHLAHRDPNYN